MGEVVNLRLRRKRAARRAAEATAAGNRQAHGLPKTLREQAKREAAAQSARLDAHRLSDGDDVAGDGARRPGDPR